VPGLNYPPHDLSAFLYATAGNEEIVAVRSEDGELLDAEPARPRG
jgi:hypothetical protein